MINGLIATGIMLRSRKLYVTSEGVAQIISRLRFALRGTPQERFLRLLRNVVCLYCFQEYLSVSLP